MAAATHVRIFFTRTQFLQLQYLNSRNLCRNINRRIENVRWQSTETVQEPSKNQESIKAPDDKQEAGKETINAAEMSPVEKLLSEEKGKLQDLLANTTDKYKRALAETENVRTRYKRQLEESKLYAIQGFCKDLLEVSDILDTAIKSVPEAELKRQEGNEHLRNLFQGLEMTETQLQKVFKKHNLVKIDPLGDKFDPNLHEAMFQVPATEGKNPNEVAIVTKVGYRLHSRTLRPAVVGVVKA